MPQQSEKTEIAKKHWKNINRAYDDKFDRWAYLISVYHRLRGSAALL